MARFIAGVELADEVDCGACLGTTVLEDEDDDRAVSDCHHCGGDGSGRSAKALALLAGPEPFDVHAVRSAAEEMLRQAERDLVELEVFKDWTRSQGRGPENREAGAFGRVESRSFDVRPLPDGSIDVDGVIVTYSPEPTEGLAHVALGLAAAVNASATLASRGFTARGGSFDLSIEQVGPARGGWPGTLSREYASKRCPTCDGGRKVLVSDCDNDPDMGCGLRDDGKFWHVFDCFDGDVDCTACDGRGWIPHGDRRADIVTAPARARLARRVLDALEGQPSECEECEGDGVVVVFDEDESGPVFLEDACPDCRGTGHNLRGVLASPWPAVVRRKVLDGVHTNDDDSLPDDWTETMGIPFPPDLDHDDPTSTRVVARGVHRDDHEPENPYSPAVTLSQIRLGQPVPELDQRIDARGWGARMPRWRRGEIRHAERRARIQQDDVGPSEGWEAESSHLRSGSAWASPCVGLSWPEDAWDLDDLNELIGVSLDGDVLRMWKAHPRKGATRLVEFALPDGPDDSLRAYLAEAKDRAWRRLGLAS